VNINQKLRIILAAIAITGNTYTNAQCPSSGTAIAYAWINPAGTYLDLGSKRPLNATHHKIFDLRTGKFVKTGEGRFDDPLKGFGFPTDFPTRISFWDRTNWSDDYTSIWVIRGKEELFKKSFPKYTKILYDTIHNRGIIVEPIEKNAWRYSIYYLLPGSAPELIEKVNISTDVKPYRFSPDGHYLVCSNGLTIDMEKRKVLSTKISKKISCTGEPAISPDSRFAAFDTRLKGSGGECAIKVYDMATQELVRDIPVPDSFIQDGGSWIFPLSDMQRAVIVRTPPNALYYNMPGRAYLLAGGTVTPLCYPSWQRERDELEGKTSTVYNETEDAGSGCPMEVAAMEADGKWEFSSGGQSGVLYLSARASGEVSGNYTYTNGSAKIKGKLSGKLSTNTDGKACTHTVTGTFDETLFGGAKGALSLRVNGKGLSGTAGSTAWTGEKK
jgi:hypothetical protein